MAAVPDVKSQPTTAEWLEWIPVALGLLALFVPTFVMLAEDQWHHDEQAHAPIILAVAAWLLWTQRAALNFEARPAKPTGLSIVALALLLYVLGRALDIGSLEAASLAPLLIGLILCMRGWHALRKLWFPILFIIFYVPLPSVFVDWVTGPLKQQVSAIAEMILYAVGYPVARSGIVLTIGPYQLLVADACAGLQSMFTLSALGALYVYLTERPRFVHNLLMLLAILPIAFLANLVRVLTLMLVTFHFGDEVGQGFLHGWTGIFLFVIALLSLMSFDSVLAKLLRPVTRTAR